MACNAAAGRAMQFAQRVRFLSVAMAVAFVLAAAAAYWPYDDALDRWGTPWGGDFPMFYVAGQTAAEGQWGELYDAGAQQQRLHRLFPTLAADYTLPYRYPPLVAAMLAPLSQLPYAAAYLMFLGLSGAAWAVAARLTVCSSGVPTEARPSAYWVALGFPVAWEVMLGGQASHFALLIATLGVFFLQRSRPVAAGMVLGLALYKPNVLAMFVLGCLARFPRCLIGIAVSSSLALAASWWFVGYAGVLEYFDYATRLAVTRWQLETPPWKVHGLGAWVALVLPGAERRAVLALGLLATGVLVWRWRQAPRTAQATQHYTALLLLINALGNPYVPIYDLVLVLPVALLLVGRLAVPSSSRPERMAAAIVLGLLAFGPHLSQAIAKSQPVPQLFPLLLLMAAVVLVCHGRPTTDSLPFAAHRPSGGGTSHDTCDTVACAGR